MGQAWWSGTAGDLIAADPGAVFLALAAQSPFDVVKAQTTAWTATISHLQAVARDLPDSHFFLEFAIPRMGRRADAVIVRAGHVFVIEYKVGTRDFPRHARAQAEGYALDLAHFHETSRAVPLVPILVATGASPQDIPLFHASAPGVAAPICLSPADLAPAIRHVSASPAPSLDPTAWAAGSYRPTPTIIEAAQALFGGHQVAAIARAGAANLAATTEAVDGILEQASVAGEKVIIFLTGVPGAGKTLAGLGIAARHMQPGAGIPATYLSGNGPLVTVLQEALLRDERRRQTAAEPGERPVSSLGRRKADSFIQSMHKWRDQYAEDPAPPADRIVIFDEAQRAWTAHETARFMIKKGHEGWTQSEPAFSLSVMDRHRGMAAVICLVGEGQEINRGEAGIGAWIEALAQGGLARWQVHAPNHLLTADSGLPRQTQAYLQLRAGRGNPALHLAVSMRSFKAAQVSAFVADLLGEDAAKAKERLPDANLYPIVRTRSLAAARRWLNARRRATERAGLVASANALRLKPEGLFVKAKVDPANWFLAPSEDIRSSDMLEDAATEYDVQGLELDWTGVAWDLDLSRGATGWVARGFAGTRWQPRDSAGFQDQRRAYTINSYRVLLTRARQGMVIFVPHGSHYDATRPPQAYDAIDRWLAASGIPLLGD